MHKYTEKHLSCPHCGHAISITLDASNGSQDFYDDCPVCCNAIHLDMQVDEMRDRINLSIDADDEQVFWQIIFRFYHDKKRARDVLFLLFITIS